ncbi:hypothetical protein [Candidatus Chromulinivorax destructor]|nr:hypothetical protein [Candidatus Chromulinivorax destructor]
MKYTKDFQTYIKTQLTKEEIAQIDREVDLEFKKSASGQPARKFQELS